MSACGHSARRQSRRQATLCPLAYIGSFATVPEKRYSVELEINDLKTRKQQLPNSPINRLLAALPKTDYRRIMTQMERVSLDSKELAYEVDKPIKFVYFPLTGVFSLVTVMEDG